MELTPEQREHVAQWVRDELSLSDIQKRLENELGVRMTYMEVRFLVDDLGLELSDKPVYNPEPDVSKSGPADASSGAGAAGATPGQVTVEVDKVVRPGALVSGSVVFSDGVSAQWHVDQTGRLALQPAQEGYRPPEGDIQTFQEQLSQALQRAGF